LGSHDVEAGNAPPAELWVFRCIETRWPRGIGRSADADASIVSSQSGARRMRTGGSNLET
jgi:hypothetical protein